MSSFLIALLGSISLSVWLYSKVSRHTGGDSRNSLIVVAVSGVLLFGISWFLLDMFLP